MITISMIRSQMDTLETDASIRLELPQVCEWCHKQIVVAIVMLGSQQDQALTSRNASPILAGIGNVVERILNPKTAGGKIVRVRLRASQLATLRGRRALAAKSPCPYCQLPLEIRLQPA